MKKIILILSCIVLASSVLFATVQPNVSRTGSSFAPMVGDENKYDLGTSTEPWRTIYSSGIAGGITTRAYFTDVPARSSATIFSVTITTVVAASSTVYAGYISQPVFPRTLQVSLYFDIGKYSIKFATLPIYGTCLVSGKDQNGVAVSEIIVATNTASDYGREGKIAFSYIDYMKLTTSNKIKVNSASLDTVDVLTNGVTWIVGVSTAIGIPGKVNYPTDIIQVIEASTTGTWADSTTYVLDTEHSTIVFANQPDGENDAIVDFKNRNIEK